jgi:chemotaxis protein MotB
MGELPNREVPVRIIYRKKRHGHGHHGGAWKVAFADFMTAMFALFLVLWLIEQSSDIKSAIAGYFQDPLGRANEFGSSILPGEGAQAAISRPLSQPEVVDLRRERMFQFAKYLQERLDQLPDLASVRQHIEIEVTREGLRIQLLEDSVGVFFETGSAVPSRSGQELLALLGSELGNLPNHVLIEGYTDARPYSGLRRYSNWELSADRANTARRILTESGLAASQVSQIRGYADRELRDPSDPYSGRNRRVAITLLFDDPGPTADADTAAAGARAGPLAGAPPP